MEAFQRRAVSAVLRRLFGTLLDDYHVETASLRRVVLTSVRVNADRVNAFLTSAPFRVLHCTIDRVEAHFGGPSNSLAIGTVVLTVALSGGDSSAGEGRDAAASRPGPGYASPGDGTVEGVDAVAQLLSNFSSTSRVSLQRVVLRLDCVDATRAHPCWSLHAEGVLCSLMRGEDAVALSAATALHVAMDALRIGVAMPAALPHVSPASGGVEEGVVWVGEVSPAEASSTAISVVVPLSAPPASAAAVVGVTSMGGNNEASTVAVESPARGHTHACAKAHACARATAAAAGCVCTVGMVHVVVSSATVCAVVATHGCSIAAARERRAIRKKPRPPPVVDSSTNVAPLIVVPTTAKARLKSAWTSMKRAARAFMRGDASTHTLMMQSHRAGHALVDMASSLRQTSAGGEVDMGASVVRPTAGHASLSESMFMSAHSHSVPAEVAVDDDAFHAHISTSGDAENEEEASDASPPRVPIVVHVACVSVAVVGCTLPPFAQRVSLADATSTMTRVQLEVYGCSVRAASSLSCSASHASVCVWHPTSDAAMVPSRVLSLTRVCAAVVGEASCLQVDVGVDDAFLCVDNSIVAHLHSHGQAIMAELPASDPAGGSKATATRLHACLKSATVTAPLVVLRITEACADIHLHASAPPMGEGDEMKLSPHVPAGVCMRVQSALSTAVVCLETVSFTVDGAQVLAITPPVSTLSSLDPGNDVAVVVGNVNVNITHAIVRSLISVYTDTLPSLLAPLHGHALPVHDTRSKSPSPPMRHAMRVRVLTITHTWPQGGLQLELDYLSAFLHAASDVQVAAGGVTARYVSARGHSHVLLSAPSVNDTTVLSFIRNGTIMHVTCISIHVDALEAVNAASHVLEAGEPAMLIAPSVASPSSEAQHASDDIIHAVFSSCRVDLGEHCHVAINAANIRLGGGPALAARGMQQRVQADLDVTACVGSSVAMLCGRLELHSESLGDAALHSDPAEDGPRLSYTACDHVNAGGGAASTVDVAVSRADARVHARDLEHVRSLQAALPPILGRLSDAYELRVQRNDATSKQVDVVSDVDSSSSRIQSEVHAAMGVRLISHAHIVPVGGFMDDAAAPEDVSFQAPASPQVLPDRPLSKRTTLLTTIQISLDHACIALVISGEHVLSLLCDDVRFHQHVHAAGAAGTCTVAQTLCEHDYMDEHKYPQAWSCVSCTHVCARSIALCDGDRTTSASMAPDDIPVAHLPRARLDACTTRAVQHDRVCTAPAAATDLTEMDVNVCLPALAIRASGSHVRALDVLSRTYDDQLDADAVSVLNASCDGAAVTATRTPGPYLRHVRMCPCLLDLDFDPQDVAATVTLPGVAHTVALRLGLPSATISISLLPVAVIVTLPRVSVHACDVQEALASLSRDLGQHVYSHALPQAMRGISSIAAARVMTHVASTQLGGHVLHAALSVLPAGAMQRLVAAREGAYVYLVLLAHALWATLWGGARVLVARDDDAAPAVGMQTTPGATDALPHVADATAEHITADEEWVVLS